MTTMMAYTIIAYSVTLSQVFKGCFQIKMQNVYSMILCYYTYVVIVHQKFNKMIQDLDPSLGMYVCVCFTH